MSSSHPNSGPREFSDPVGPKLIGVNVLDTNLRLYPYKDPLLRYVISQRDRSSLSVALSSSVREKILLGAFSLSLSNSKIQKP